MQRKYKYRITLGYVEKQYINYVYELETDKPLDQEVDFYGDLDLLVSEQSLEDVKSWVGGVIDRTYLGDNSVEVDEV
ncbi:hypothetical protein L3V83_10715 [Thiotrichales bacterium 19X7-9]|nr:hypothetical protein [Thiotrichales bacterium 19X7-9]